MPTLPGYARMRPAASRYSRAYRAPSTGQADAAAPALAITSASARIDSLDSSVIIARSQLGTSRAGAAVTGRPAKISRASPNFGDDEKMQARPAPRAR